MTALMNYEYVYTQQIMHGNLCKVKFSDSKWFTLTVKECESRLVNSHGISIIFEASHFPLIFQNILSNTSTYRTAYFVYFSSRQI